MKKLKIIISLLIIIFFAQSVRAEATYCCSTPTNMSCAFTKSVTNALGFNLLAKKIAKSQIKKVLMRNANGKYDVKIDSYSAIDLKQGKFKTLEITGENISTNGLHVSIMKLRTLCEYNHVDYRKKPVVFYTDVPMYFETIVSEDDLNNTLKDLGYFKRISDLNIYGISLFVIDDVSFKIKNNKIYLEIKVKAPLLLGDRYVKFTCSAKLNVQDGKIVLENISTPNIRAVNTYKLVEMINEAKLLDIPIQMFEGHKSVLSVNNIKILDNKIYINGIIVVKRADNEQTKEEK